MKIYISADIEGITGIAHWDEAEKEKPAYSEFAKQMTNEVKAACEGATAAGAREIWVKDAHDSGRNILAAELPQNIRLVRGWSNHPFSMVQELNNSFNALIMIGYHSPAGSDHNPLSHTLSLDVTYVKINGIVASEFLIHGYAAATLGVPVVFVSGDEGICNEAIGANTNISTVSVNWGVGDSSISIHPQLAVKLIRDSVQAALTKDVKRCMLKLPAHFNVEIGFKTHQKAYRASFYPGMTLTSATTVMFKTDTYFEVLRMLLFAV